MIDNYTWISIILRILAEGIFIYIFLQQLIVFRGKSDYKRLQLLLLVALFFLVFGNAFTLGSNLFREPDGNLTETTRQISSVINGVATLGAAVALYLINKFKLK